MRGSAIDRSWLRFNRRRQLGFSEYIAYNRPTMGIQFIASSNYNTKWNASRGVHIDQNNLPG
jgi:hypothetical protein